MIPDNNRPISSCPCAPEPRSARGPSPGPSCAYEIRESEFYHRDKGRLEDAGKSDAVGHRKKRLGEVAQKPFALPDSFTAIRLSVEASL
jgi:hypothetical protein